MKKKIFFIGLGNMGHPMSLNLLKAGYPVHIYDLDKSKAKGLLEWGAIWSDVPEETIKEVDLVVTSLPGPPQVAELYLSDNGLLAFAKEGTSFIDTSTSSVELAEEIYSRAQERKLHYLEAPISNGVNGARAGKLVFFIAGDEKAYLNQKDVFETLGKDIHFVGKSGNGLTIKLLTNLFWFVHAAVIGEGLMIGAKAEIPLDTLWKAITSSAGNSWVAEHDIPSIFEGHYDPSFSLALCCKDLDLVNNMAKKQGFELSMGGLALELFEKAKDKFGPEAPELSVVRLLEEETGRLLRPEKREADVDLVCFGTITPAMVLVIDQLPEQNTGACINDYRDFISDDAVIIACLLRHWGIRSGIITSVLGDDERSRQVVKQLESLGVVGNLRLDPNIRTPFEVNISDSSGARTYLWQRKEEILDTLDSASLSLLYKSRLLYVDWYDGDRILRPIKKANELSIPVFLNLEHGHQNAELLERYVQKTTICQATTDAAQQDDESGYKIAQKLLEAGTEIAVITLAAEGCLIASATETFRIKVPDIAPIDVCGAGATFSAGFIFGYLEGWTLKETAQFATAAASLKCERVGLNPSELKACKQLAAKLKVQDLIKINSTY